MKTTRYGSIQDVNENSLEVYPSQSYGYSNIMGYIGICIVLASILMFFLSICFAPKFVAPVIFYQTSKVGATFTSTILTSTVLTKHVRPSYIRFDPNTRFQEIMGFGGAFTESSCWNLQSLPAYVRDTIMDMYFGDDGLRYSLGRMHINSCDFSLSSYSYDESNDDYDLINFDTSLARDGNCVAPLILEAASRTSDPLRLIASPWSPPGWMKKGGSMIGSDIPSGLISDQQTLLSWAKYLRKFVDLYKTNYNISIWGITIQNEPQFACPVWESCVYNASFESIFLHQYLANEFQGSDVKIFIYDHNKDSRLVDWVQTMSGTAFEFDGVAVHWYAEGGNRLLDGSFGSSQLEAVHSALPDHLLFSTEGCSCPGVAYDDWFRAERFAHDVLNSFNHWVQAYIDWNLILDSEGGPNHAHNYCDAAMIAMNDSFKANLFDFDPDGSNWLHRLKAAAFNMSSHVHLQPKLFVMAHFSRFIPRGSHRILSSCVGDYQDRHQSPSNVIAGIEVTLHPCEHSARQSWKFVDGNGDSGKLMLSFNRLDENNEDDWIPASLCIADPKTSTGVDGFMGSYPGESLLLVSCDGNDLVNFQLDYKSGNIVQLSKNGNYSDYCLGTELLNGERVVRLLDCSLATIWDYDGKSGSLKAKDLLENHHCLTAGWPFLQCAVFSTPDSSNVVVLLNEADEFVDVEIEDIETRRSIKSSIPGRSIQTYVL